MGARAQRLSQHEFLGNPKKRIMAERCEMDWWEVRLKRQVRLDQGVIHACCAVRAGLCHRG